MTCAKVEVHAYLVTPDGKVYHGTNWCASPQLHCPRAPGEDYSKCHSICGISAHAEVNAIVAAGDAAPGSIIVVDYHYVCDACQQECHMSKVKPMTVEEFIAAGGSVERLDDTQRIKHIDMHTFNAAQFGNLAPKSKIALPPAPRKARRHRMNVPGRGS